MKFILDAADRRSLGLKELYDDDYAPQHVELDTLDDLLALTKKYGSDVIVRLGPEPTVTVYNGYLE